MGKLRFCANISFLFKEVSFLERYQAAADAGFKAVECGWPYTCSLEDVIKAKQAAGVEQILINTGGPENLGNASNYEAPSAFKDELSLAIQYANGLDCKKIHIMAGKVGKMSKPRAMETFIDNLKYAADQLQLHGINGLIEPLNSFLVPDYLYSTSTEALEIVKAVNKPNILYQLDFFHLQLMEGNLTYTLKKNLPKIGHIQVSQAPNRSEPFSSGEIQFSYVFDLLREVAYDGWIGCEYIPSTTTTESLQWLKKI